ncbi:MAG: UDP-N-acetylmuramoyl-L-alanyl-D-glutamate--2,6-diaminopimelate ligase [Bacillota bacterium]
MSFRDLINQLDVLDHGPLLDVLVSGIAYDSRQVQPGFMFAAIDGLVTDGHRFVPDAVARGAAAVLLQQRVPVPEGVAWAVVPDTRKGLALAAGRFYGDPGRALRLVGVTGTNGKTTTTHLITALFRARRPGVGLIGTIENRIGDEVLPVRHTTPESLDLQRLLRRMVDAGVTDVVMEVSSHALSLSRVHGLSFEAGVFTNLTQDHLDFHAGFEDYFAAKTQLFTGLGEAAAAVINRDDPYGIRLLDLTRGRPITYAVHEAADVRASGVRPVAGGVEFLLESAWGSAPVALRLSGLFNVYNALAAACVGLDRGFAPEEIAGVLEKVQGVPGRFERVDQGQEYTVIVDYAHTPDGLENVLRAAREIAPGRLISVFGCGGDRDRAKRPLMGAISARGADYSVLTSDNPRTEDPLTIIADVEEGYRRVRPDGYAVVPDRREAMRHAFEKARAGDVVVIAGKGHEDYQIVGTKRLEFDDRREAAGILAAFGYGGTDEADDDR